MHIRRKTVLGFLLACAFLLGSTAAPVAALQTNMLEESFNYAFAPGENNHTYIYIPSEEPYYDSASWMFVNEDLDLSRYIYADPGWNYVPSSFSEDTKTYFDWQQFNTFGMGSLSNSPYLPDFYDFIGDDGSGAVINTTVERRSFSLALGQETAVAMDTDYPYYGTLSISGQEFIHLTVACLEDGISWRVDVYDPEGRRMVYDLSSNGDIIVLPFKPSISGTYLVILQVTSGNERFALFNLKPNSVVPTVIAPDQTITGNLPTGEFVLLDETGSFVYDELRPTVRTYKLNPKNDISSLTYAFNYPESILGANPTTQPVSISFTSDVFVHGSHNGYRYSSTIPSPNTDIYYFRGGVYYVTVMGGDNTDFTLYHDGDIASDLPVNHEFRIDNLFGHSDTLIYSLEIEEDSVLKVNSTSPSDFTIGIWTTLDDGYRFYQSVTDHTTLEGSSSIYLPAGEYVVRLIVDSYTTDQWIEFSMGPLTTSYTTDIVNLGGIIVPTDQCEFYNLTITLNNEYNVSVPMDIYIYDQYYHPIYSNDPTLGTWFDGSDQIPHSTQESEIEVTIPSRDYSQDYAIIIFETFPYNNTVGIGNQFENYPVSLTIDWEKVTVDQFDNSEDDAIPSIDASGSSAGYNFTLEYPGDMYESYLVILNVTPGTWYNISIMTGDVDNLLGAYMYEPYYGGTHDTPWVSLATTLQGTDPDWSIQFGAISDSVYLTVTVDRDLSDEGFLWIEATPLETHVFEAPTSLKPGSPDLLATLSGMALPLGITAIVIVVLVVVYVKKFKK